MATSLDADLKAKQESKYDYELEHEVVEWIEAVTAEKKGDASVAEWLHDGKVLCNLVNKIKDSTIKKINEQAMPFKQMENITNFMNTARAWGVPESSMFGTPDLYEEKNMGSVIRCIFAFGGVVQVAIPEFAGPHLGVAMTAAAKDSKRASTTATQMGGYSGALDKQVAITGARELGARAGGDVPNADTAGLDADLKRKQEENYPHELEKEVVAWIETTLGESKGDQTVAEWLHDGKILCNLVNKIRPDTIKKINEQSMAFKQMENITYFMNAARDWGVPESSLFGTPDLYEEKNMGSVIKCIDQFGGAVQVYCPEYNGPKHGVALSVSSIDTKRDIGACTDQYEAMQRTMDVNRPTGGMKR